SPIKPVSLSSSAAPSKIPAHLYPYPSSCLRGQSDSVPAVLPGQLVSPALIKISGCRTTECFPNGRRNSLFHRTQSAVPVLHHESAVLAALRQSGALETHFPIPIL